jgi:hypothetical protein
VLNIKLLHRKQAVFNRFSTAFIAAFSALARYRRRHEGKVISYLTAESNQQRLLQRNRKNAKRIGSTEIIVFAFLKANYQPALTRAGWLCAYGCSDRFCAEWFRFQI